MILNREMEQNFMAFQILSACGLQGKLAVCMAGKVNREAAVVEKFVRTNSVNLDFVSSASF